MADGFDNILAVPGLRQQRPDCHGIFEELVGLPQ
jgi:hypothetical protein